MPYRIKGTLKLPSGQPAAGVDIEFISRRNYSPLLMDLSSIIKTTSTGAYDITLEFGEYAVVVYCGCNQPSHIGKLFVFSDTSAGLDLQTLLQQADWQPATPEYIQQIQDWLAQAGASASQAVNSAAEAKASNDAAKSEADRSKAEADRASQAVIDSAAPLPDVWAPLSDSLRMITGYGREVKVGDDVVARMVNFERSTTATYIDKSGALRTAAINEPRFEGQGLLIEGQSTNLFLNSENGVTQTISTQAGKYTLSFFGAGTVTISGSSTGSLTGVGGEIKLTNRVSITVDCSVGNALLTVSGAISKVQFEALPFASSYIPTNGTAVTRGADKCWIVTENNYISAFDTRAIAVHFDTVIPSTTELWPALLCLTTKAPKEQVIYSSKPQMVLMDFRTSSSASTSTVAANCAGGGFVVVCNRQNESVISVNGLIKKNSQFATESAALPSRVYIGMNPESSNLALFGHIRDLKIWHHPLSDAQIKGLK